MRLALGAFLVFLLCACGGAPRLDHASGVRSPSASERSGIVAGVMSAWSYEANFDIVAHLPDAGFPNMRQQHFRPEIVSIRVSRSDPSLAAAAVEVLDTKGKRTSLAAVVLLTRYKRTWSAAEVPETIFPHRCDATVSAPLRSLVCPSPWKVLGVRHQGLPASANTVVIGKTWRSIKLPGTICGATHPINMGWKDGVGDAYVHSAFWPWWPAVEVYANGPYRMPDITGRTDSDAYYRVDCSNTGGTGDGVLRSVDVIFLAKNNLNAAIIKPLRLLGIVTAQQPESLADLPPSPMSLDVVDAPYPLRPRLVVQEAWYGPYDSTCCPSGRASTIWKYEHGQLIPVKTLVVLPPATLGGP